MAQEAPRAETTQSLEDISSSFVSSLVGGPQRPVTTVMDWISMQSQERPAPLVPHEVRLDAGAVQMEIQKMVKQGGGHVVMELTPPDQSKFTIELKLDERGNALLIVEGVSDSTKTRLEQSAPQLREQFQQMGLELQLDMRQQDQSASSNAGDSTEGSGGFIIFIIGLMCGLTVVLSSLAIYNFLSHESASPSKTAQEQSDTEHDKTPAKEGHDSADSNHPAAAHESPAAGSQAKEKTH
jgi:hypothetical protein